MLNPSSARDRMVEAQIARRGVRDANVLRAMANTVMHAGATVDGEPSELHPNWRPTGAQQY